jgi:serine/threonine-protein kinase
MTEGQVPIETYTHSILRRPILAGVGIALAIALVGGGVFVWLRSLDSGKPSVVGPVKTNVTGEFILTNSDTAIAGCIGQGGYSDISPGVPVILTNQDGKILGSSALGSGVADSSAGTCTYTFTIPDVPEDQSQYAIEVSHRGKVVNSKSDMAANGWKFGLSMGN